MLDRTPSEIFARPTSVFLSGENRPLLNWVAYALIAAHPGGFVWSDVRLGGEVLDPTDLLVRDVLPRERFLTVAPGELARDDFAGNVALGGLVRSDEPPEAVRRFADFLRLPPRTQRLLARLPRREPPVVIVLSNGHRLAALYPTNTVAPTLRSIVEWGASFLMTWADALLEGRLAFEQIFHLRGGSVAAWREVVLTVERGTLVGPLQTGTEVRLGDWPAVAELLGRTVQVPGPSLSGPAASAGGSAKP